MTRLRLLPPMILAWLCLVQPGDVVRADDLMVSVADSLALPAGCVAGLTWAGADTLAMLVSRTDDQGFDETTNVTLVVGDTTGTIYWQEDFSGVLTRGLAWDGEFLWSCGDDDGGGSLLYKIRVDTVGVAEVYPAPGHRPMDLAFDGRWLWITDRDNGSIDRIDPETGNLTRTVAAPGFSPGGLTYDGQGMWVADAGTGRLTRMRGGRLQRRNPVAAEDWFLRGYDVLLGFDGQHVWSLAENDSLLRQWRLGI